MASKHIFLISFFIFLLGCDSKLSVQKFSQLVVESVSCENFETQMFDSLLMAVDNDSALPKPKDLELQLQKDFVNIENYEKHIAVINEIIINFVKLYTDIYINNPSGFDTQAIYDLKKYLISIETRDQMSLNQQDFIDSYTDQLKTIQKSAQRLKQSCTEEQKIPAQPIEPGTLLNFIKSNFSSEVYGAYKTFATAYQNCEAANLKALGLESKSLEGTKIIGRHFTDAGNLREISSLRDVQKTHPYISERQPLNSCFNTYNNPLIYDFGGKPKSFNTQNSELNFFINDGTGSKNLGTDCSGFIFSSLVSAGLKLHPGVQPKARHVLNYNAARFVDPEIGKVPCFKKLVINMNTELKPGDIVASSGHIFMITKTKSDSLGIAKKTSLSSCESITEQDFDFELMQSSPSLGAIGINKMRASDYLSDSKTMREGLIEFAKKLCKSRLNNQNYKQTSKMSIVRHKKTPECKMQSEIRLTGQSCIYDCKIN